MKVGSAAPYTRSRTNSPLRVGLTALAGFAAGVCLVGLMTFRSSPTLKTDERAATNGSSDSATIAPVPGPAVASGAREPEGVAAPAPWPYEGATPEARRRRGEKRPDLLGAPDGWTYAP
jgi:hypothetical protein